MTAPQIEAVNASLATCKLERCWLVHVELADRDDARVREAPEAAAGLAYGPYRGVAFERATGVRFVRPADGSRLGADAEPVAMPARVLSLSAPCDPQVLACAVEAVRHAHPHEKLVIYVHQVWASRAGMTGDRKNPNR